MPAMPPTLHPVRRAAPFGRWAIVGALALGGAACGSSDSSFDNGRGIQTILAPDDAIAVIAQMQGVVVDTGLLAALEQFSPEAARTRRAKDEIVATCAEVSQDPQCTGTVTYSATFPLRSNFDRFPANSYYSEVYRDFQAADIFGGAARSVEIRYDFLNDFPTHPPYSGRMVLALVQTLPSEARSSTEYRFDNLSLLPAGSIGPHALNGVAATTYGPERRAIRYDFRGWSTGITTIGATAVIEGEDIFSFGGTGFVDIRVVESTAQRTVYQVVGKAAPAAKTDTRFVTESRDETGEPTYTAR